MPYPANAIANFFVKKAISENDQSLTPMKLIKMIYLSHGWNLATHNEPLIDEPVLAWKYGPVIKSVYDNFKYFGNKPIDTPAHDFITQDNTVSIVAYEINKNDSVTENMLSTIWEKCKSTTGIQLSNWSHDKEGPWYSIWHFKGSNHVIPDDLIGSYFKKIAKGSMDGTSD